MYNIDSVSQKVLSDVNNMIIQKVQIEKRIRLSTAWVSLFEFVQAHPFITFEQLIFENGEPKIGTRDIKVTESVRF